MSEYENTESEIEDQYEGEGESTDDLLDQLYEDVFDDEEDDDGEEDSPEPAPKPEPVADEKKFKIAVDGEERELTLEEIKANDKLIEDLAKSGLRRDDYTQKTQQLAEQRRAQEQEADQKVREVEQYLPWQEHQLQNEYQNIMRTDWMAHNDSDPVEAQRLMFRKQQIENEYNDIQRVKQEINTFRENQVKSRVAAETAPAIEILRENIPILVSGSQKEIQDLKQDLIDHGQKKFGLTPAEFEKLDGVLGARTLTAIYESMMYNRMNKQSKDIVKQKTVKKSAPKLESPSSTNDFSDDQEDVIKNSRKARKSGSARDLQKSTNDLLDILFE